MAILVDHPCPPSQWLWRLPIGYHYFRNQQPKTTDSRQPTCSQPLFPAARLAFPLPTSPIIISLAHVALREPVASCDGFPPHRCVNLYFLSYIFPIVVTPASSPGLLVMAEDDYAMRVVGAVQDSATQTQLALRGMKTPEAAFQEKQAALNASVDQAFEAYYSAQSGAEAEKLRKTILDHGADLRQLRQDHQATLGAKTKDFEHQRRLEIESLCRRLVNAVGRDLFQKALRDVTNNPADAASGTSAPANQPTPPATEAESEIVSPAEHSVRPPPASLERPVRADARASSALRICTSAKHGICC